MINAAALSFCIKKDKNVHINSRLKRKGETDMKAKDIKKFALCLLAALILTGGTACGNDKNMNNDNGTASENSVHDDGVVGDTGEALKDGVEDLGEDVRDGVEGAGDSIRDNAENATENR